MTSHGLSPSDTPSVLDKVRDPFLDNAKFFAVWLVVFGHAIASMRMRGSVGQVYTWVYLFHMPLFCFLSGYVSHSRLPKSYRPAHLVQGILFPLLLNQVLFTLLYYVENQRWYDPVQPLWLLWYLWALFIWRALLPYIMALRWPLAVSIAISLVTTLSPSLDGDFSGGRIVAFLPFFVGGHIMKQRGWIVMRPTELPRRRLWQAGAVVFMIASLLAIRTFWPELNAAHVRALVLAGVTPAESGWFGWAAIGQRAVHLTVAGALIACVLLLVPARRHWFTDFGRYTMYAYLLHGYVRQLLDLFGLRDFYQRSGTIGLLVVAAVTLVLTAALCSPPVRLVTKWLIEPKWPWALRRNPEPEKAAA